MVPGTCGELIQGKLNNLDFLISFPVNLYSKVIIELNNTGIIEVKPWWCTKAKEAVKATMTLLKQQQLGVKVTIVSQLPIGKGWASSSADIIGAIYGTALALNKNFTYEEVAQLAISIEPTDGVFLPGLAVFNHIKGNSIELLGPSLEMQVLTLEFEEAINTIDFNNCNNLLNLNKEKEAAVACALNLIKQGIKEQEASKVAQGATISAFAHQRILNKPYLQEILNIALKHGALGINIAHSGTTIGILFSHKKNISEKLIQHYHATLPNLHKIRLMKSICGGVKTMLWNNYSIGS